MRELALHERLVVFADFDPHETGGSDASYALFSTLLAELEGSGVCVKVESILRFYGWGLIGAIKEAGLKAFADAKLVGTPKTLRACGAFLREKKPDYLTVMCHASRRSMQALRESSGEETRILGVGTLTSFTPDECEEVHMRHPLQATLVFAELARRAGLDGLVLGAHETDIVRRRLPKYRPLIAAENVRPLWSPAGEDTDAAMRSVTPTQAIGAGADLVICGRAVTHSRSHPRDAPRRPRDAIDSILAEVEDALTSLKKGRGI